RAHEGAGARARRPLGHRERRLSRLHHHRDDREAAGDGAGRAQGPHPARPPRHARGRGRGDRLPRLPTRGHGHRPDLDGRRRHGHGVKAVTEAAESITTGGESNMASFDESKVKEIIAKELEVDVKQLTPEAKFIEDLGADSLDIVELVMALEEEFGLDIPDEDADKLKTVGDAMNYLQQHAGK